MIVIGKCMWFFNDFFYWFLCLLKSGEKKFCIKNVWVLWSFMLLKFVLIVFFVVFLKVWMIFKIFLCESFFGIILFWWNRVGFVIIEFVFMILLFGIRFVIFLLFVWKIWRIVGVLLFFVVFVNLCKFGINLLL